MANLLKAVLGLKQKPRKRGVFMIKDAFIDINYYSQFGQDKYLDQTVFKGKTNGFFVEIGAYDGIKFSNTYFFEKYRNWQGICVEPIPEQYELLKRNRSCHCFSGCISDKIGHEKFLHVHGGEEYRFVHRELGDRIVGKEHTEMLSGLIQHYHPKHLELIKKEISELNVDANNITVQCHFFEDILSQTQIKHINYLSVDTEGSEFDILKSIDFDKHIIDVISVEVLYPDIPIRSFLEEKGYSFIKRCEYDDIYQKKQLIS